MNQTRPYTTFHDREELKRDAQSFYATFRGVLRAAESLVIGERSREYGPPASNFLHGDESYMQMLWVKMSRLMNLMEVKRDALSTGGWLAYSDFDRGRLADSLIDLINYTGFWAASIVQANCWPKNVVQVRPFDGQEQSSDGDEVVWPTGQEKIQCPRCQNPVTGFFGREGDKWFVGCSDCGFCRRSPNIAALFLWYAETGQHRQYGRYGPLGDPTHQPKIPHIKTVPRPNPQFYVDNVPVTREEYEAYRSQHPDDPLVIELEERDRTHNADLGEELERQTFEDQWFADKATEEAPDEAAVVETLEHALEEVQTLKSVLEAQIAQEEHTGGSHIPLALAGLNIPEPTGAMNSKGLSLTKLSHLLQVSGIDLNCSCGGVAEGITVPTTGTRTALQVTCPQCKMERVFSSEKTANRFFDRARAEMEALAKPGKELSDIERAEILNEMKD